MTHRIEQIIDAAAAAIAARVERLGAHVYTHRRFSIDPDQDELPAISVDLGPEDPAQQNTSFIDSVLRVPITFFVAGATEADASAQLLRWRREVHRALMADQTLALPFVVSTTFGGAEDPEDDRSGELFTLQQTAPWLVYYRMTIADPGDGAD